MKSLFTNKKNIKSNKGFIIVEILVAASIITMSVLSATVVANKSINVSRQALHATQAAFLLEEGAEAVRINRDNAWSNISGLTVGSNYYPSWNGTTWTIASGTGTVGIFTRRIVLSSVNRDGNGDIAAAGTLDPRTKLVTVTVTWNQAGITVTKTLSFYIADIFT